MKKLPFKQARELVKTYCREDGIPRGDYAPVLECVKRIDFSEMNQSDWFLLSDALGVSSERDDDSEALYQFASRIWFNSVGKSSKKPIKGLEG